MKTNPSTNDMQDALARVEKARANRTKAATRLSRAQSAVEAAVKEVSVADDELKASASHLDQTVRKGISMAMKKGGTDISIAMAEIIARSLSGASDGASEPSGDQTAPDVGGTPAPTPAAAGDGSQPDLLGDAE